MLRDFKVLFDDERLELRGPPTQRRPPSTAVETMRQGGTVGERGVGSDNPFRIVPGEEARQLLRRRKVCEPCTIFPFKKLLDEPTWPDPLVTLL